MWFGHLHSTKEVPYGLFILHVQLDSTIGPSDEVNYMLNKPYEMAMVYEGTVIGDGKEAVDIITDAERVLTRHGIAVPDHSKVQFSSIKELNGWGNDFDGRFLSIILK